MKPPGGCPSLRQGRLTALLIFSEECESVKSKSLPAWYKVLPQALEAPKVPEPPQGAGESRTSEALEEGFCALAKWLQHGPNNARAAALVLRE